jgi:acyl carrier protein phosphodiesterase
MNYLAHTLLSPGDVHVLMGNVWGDLLKPSDFQDLTPGIREGIAHHRRIDAFTDAHPAVETMVRLLRPHQGKYTPVVTDVLMDFMLSKYWNQYAGRSIEDFCLEKYEVFKSNFDLMPQRILPRIHRMVDDRWLESCKNRMRMERTLCMLSMRASFSNTISAAMDAYDMHIEELDELFHTFFADATVEFKSQ